MGGLVFEVGSAILELVADWAIVEPEEGLARVSARRGCPVEDFEVAEPEGAIREPEAGWASLDFVGEQVGVLGKLEGQSVGDSSCLVAELGLGWGSIVVDLVEQSVVAATRFEEEKTLNTFTKRFEFPKYLWWLLLRRLILTRPVRDLGSDGYQ